MLFIHTMYKHIAMTMNFSIYNLNKLVFNTKIIHFFKTTVIDLGF